jgi:hypothetical protein
MKGTAKEWADKAEADYSTAARELKAPESPNFDAVCFHAQRVVGGSRSVPTGVRSRQPLHWTLGIYT